MRWETFPMTNLSITVITEFQNVCDKIIRDAGIIALRELCENILILFHQQENDGVMSSADDVIVSSAISADDLTVEHSMVNQLHVTENTEDDSHKSCNDSLNHYDFHEDNKSFVCYVCKNIYNDYTKLTVHEALHVEEHVGIESKDSLVKMSIMNSINETLPKTSEKVLLTSQNDAIIVYKCPVCSKLFENSLGLDDHVKTHTSNSTLCLECGKKFQSPYALRRHQLIHTGERPYACSICGKTFNDSSTFKKHNLCHTGERKHVCLLCGKRYRANFTLLAHIRRTHKIEKVSPTEKIVHVNCKPTSTCTYPCLQCNKSFIGSLSLNKHVQRKHPIHEKNCDTLVSLNDDSIVLGNEDNIVFEITEVTLSPDGNKINSQSENIIRDIEDGNLIKLSEFPHGINCVTNYSDINEPHADKATHSQDVKISVIKPKNETLSTTNDKVLPVFQNGEEIVYQCSVCSKLFDNSLGLDDHVKTHTRKPTLCLECGKKFQSPYALRRHQLIHTGERPYVCSICGKTFNDSSTLIKHNLCHTGEQKHVCVHCGQRYRTNYTLVAHIRRTHKLEDCPYMCMKCGKRCAVAHDLKVHEVGCKDERPYACRICDKRFSTAGNVVKHQRVHSGARPYACSICEKKFTQAFSAREHIRIIHNGDRPFQCALCKRTFTTRTEQKRHNLIHSRERPYPCTMCEKSFTRSAFLKMHVSKH